MSDRQGRIEKVQIAMLGPLEVHADDGTPVEVTGARLRTLLILLALTVLSVEWTSSDESAFADAVRLAAYLGAFLLAGLVIGRGMGGAALAGIAMAGTAVGVIAVGSRLLGVGAGDAELVGSLLSASGRLSYPLGYWNALALAADALLVLALSFSASSRSVAVRAGGAALGYAAVIAVLLAASRAGVAAAVVGIVLWLWLRRDRVEAALLVLVTILPAAAVAGWAFTRPALVEDGRPGRFDAELAREVLRKVGLEEKIGAYPDQLSGGQQQRVAIARSLAMRPQLMLFDEITSALDPELTGEVLKVLEAMARGKAVVTTSLGAEGFTSIDPDPPLALADSSEDDPPPEQSAATATPTPTATAPQEASPQETLEPTPTPEPIPLLTADKVTELEYTEGETVRFRVRSSELDEVHVHGYDLMKDVEAGKTTTMSFKASITGIFEIELEDAQTPIGELRVDPE